MCTSDCSAKQQVFLSIDNVLNNYYVPTSNPSLVISSLLSSQIVKDTGSILHQAVTPILTPYTMSKVTVTRSNRYYTLESDFTFSIQLHSDQYLLDSCIIRVTLPVSQLQKIGEDYYLLKSNNVARVALTKVSSTATAFVMEFKVFDKTSTEYSFVLKGFQNAASNPTSTASNSISVELLTEDYYVMS